MPTYEYACTACGQHVEVVQSMSDEPLRECGNCGGALRKVFSPIGIVFKGSGFYRNDSRAGAGRSSTSSDNGGGKSESPSTSKTPSTTSTTSSSESKGSSEKSA